jgi:glutaryl-CoA dehydrogenase
MNAPEHSARPQFKWEDPLLLDAQLSEEERMVRDTAHAYAQDKLMPRVRDAFRHEQTDPAIFREMGALGLLGASIPPEYGGAGLNYVCYGLIAREVERVDSGYRSMMSVQSSLVMYPDLHVRQRSAAAQVPAEARDRRMDRLLRPDRAQPRLRSRLDGDARRTRAGGFKLLGRKMWITIRPSPTFSSCGRRTTRASSAASSSTRA